MSKRKRYSPKPVNPNVLALAGIGQHDALLVGQVNHATDVVLRVLGDGA